VQALAAVDVRLGLLERQVREQAPEWLEALAAVRAAVSGATERLRALLFDLEPPDLHHGLTGALRRAADEMFEGTATRWRVDGDREPDMPEATLAVAYRIVLEALTNVRRHARAQRLQVTVAGGRSGLEVAVADDGVGLGPEPVRSPPGHRGLLTMRDRAALAGGRCTVEGRPEGGTRVTLWLPGPTSVQ
jgi:signal transduction histidine kinase